MELSTPQYVSASFSKSVLAFAMLSATNGAPVCMTYGAMSAPGCVTSQYCSRRLSFAFILSVCFFASAGAAITHGVSCASMLESITASYCASRLAYIFSVHKSGRRVMESQQTTQLGSCTTP